MKHTLLEGLGGILIVVILFLFVFGFSWVDENIFAGFWGSERFTKAESISTPSGDDPYTSGECQPYGC